MHVAVSGGTGFIGRPLVDALETGFHFAYPTLDAAFAQLFGQRT